MSFVRANHDVLLLGMPVQFAALQIIFCVLAVVATSLLARVRYAANIWAVVVVALVVVGLAVERYTDLSWRAMTLGIPSLVYLTNQTPAGAVALSTLMVVRAPNAFAIVRSLVLGLALTCVAVWSLAWYSAPPPPNLVGRPDKTGYCPQTNKYTCSDAAATMLLYRFGINTTESDMSEVCLTRVPRGTTPLGLYCGICTKIAGTRLHARTVADITPSELPTPCLIEVGIRRNASPEIAARLEKYGWSRDYHHTVLVVRADKNGKWIDVDDPSYGRERWPTEGMQYLWNNAALTLVKQ